MYGANVQIPPATLLGFALIHLRSSSFISIFLLFIFGFVFDSQVSEELTGCFFCFQVPVLVTPGMKVCLTRYLIISYCGLYYVVSGKEYKSVNSLILFFILSEQLRLRVKTHTVIGSTPTSKISEISDNPAESSRWFNRPCQTPNWIIRLFQYSLGYFCYSLGIGITRHSHVANLFCVT